MRFAPSTSSPPTRFARPRTALWRARSKVRISAADTVLDGLVGTGGEQRDTSEDWPPLECSHRGSNDSAMAPADVSASGEAFPRASVNECQEVLGEGHLLPDTTVSSTSPAGA